jgi:hypothetical protein
MRSVAPHASEHCWQRARGELGRAEQRRLGCQHGPACGRRSLREGDNYVSVDHTDIVRVGGRARVQAGAALAAPEGHNTTPSPGSCSRRRDCLGRPRRSSRGSKAATQSCRRRRSATRPSRRATCRSTRARCTQRCGRTRQAMVCFAAAAGDHCLCNLQVRRELLRAQTVCCGVRVSRSPGVPHASRLQVSFERYKALFEDMDDFVREIPENFDLTWFLQQRVKLLEAQKQAGAT